MLGMKYIIIYPKLFNNCQVGKRNIHIICYQFIV